MTETPKLTKKARKQLQQIHDKVLTKDMVRPYRIKLICSGHGDKKHAPSNLMVLWFDREDGQIVADEESRSGNLQNTLVPREDLRSYSEEHEAFPEEHPMHEPYKKLMEMMKGHPASPSYGAARVYCRRCKLNIQRKTLYWQTVFLMLAELGIDTLDIATIRKW